MGKRIHDVTTRELEDVYGLTSQQAVELVSVRTTKGTAFGEDDLRAIKGISAKAVADLGVLVTKPAAVELSFEVKLKNDAGPTSWTGVSVLATVSYRAGSADSEASEAFPVDAAGTSRVHLTVAGAIEGVRFDVKAPSGDLLGSSMVTDARRTGVVEIPVHHAPIVMPPKAPATPPRPTLIIGRVIDRSGASTLEGKQVVIYVATTSSPSEAAFAPILSAETESKGYFYLPYPEGRVSGAFAMLGIPSAPRIPIQLVDLDDSGHGRLPARMILVVDAIAPKGDDCGCDELGFRGANQILDEFTYHAVIRTTEPAQIKSMEIDTDGDDVDLDDALVVSPILRDLFGQAASKATRLAGLEGTARSFKGLRIPRAEMQRFLESNDATDPVTVESFVLAASAKQAVKNLLPARNKLPGRHPLSVRNPIDWDDDPTVYQAASIAHGHILHYRQQWVSDGYSLGDLIYSLPLAPGQKKQIVVVDWERRESAANVQQLDYEESLYNSLTHDRDINEIAKGSLRESMYGESESTSVGFGTGGGAAGSGSMGMMSMGAAVGMAVGVGSSSSSAMQKNRRDISASNMQTVRDRLTQSASNVRSQRATVIQTVSQGERFTGHSETIANYNHCHAITIEYFEVLRHFRIQQKLIDVQECLFVPLMMGPFDAAKALRWRGILSRRLLRRQLAPAFDALERVEDKWMHSDLPATSFADENIVAMSGELKIEFRLRRPADKYDEENKEWLFNLAAWGPLALLGIAMDADKYEETFKREQAQKDAIFHRDIAPQIVERFLEQVAFYAVDLQGAKTKLEIDATLTSQYKRNGSVSVSLRIGGTGFPKRKHIEYFAISKKPELADLSETLGLLLGQLLPEHSQVIVRSGSLNYRTKHYSGSLFRQSSINNDLLFGDDVLIYTGPSQAEMRNPREEDRAAARQLVRHLNENLEYYHRVIWLNMSAERRFMLLDGIVAPNTAGGRSVASVVENRVLGIVGNSLVMPVAKGMHLDPSTTEHVVDRETGEVTSLLDYYEAVPPEPIRLAVPTRGVFAEAVMGRCNSCEKKEEHRYWRWEESPIPDSPTPFLPVDSATRRADPGSLEPKDFPQTILNIQNAPTVPDPSGVGAISAALLAKSPFKDITGLEGNQRNAMQAMQATLDAAVAFGQMAANLAGKQAALKGNDSYLQSLERAKNAGLISDEEMKGHANEYFRSLAGGSAAKPAAGTGSFTESDVFRDTVTKASDQGKDLTLEHSTRDGETTKVATQGTGKGGTQYQVRVSPDVPFVVQPTPDTCWAAAATMMRSWKLRESRTIESVMDEAGAMFRQLYDEAITDQDPATQGTHGLEPSWIPMLFENLGMGSEAPASYPISHYVDLLGRYGPLWVTVDDDQTPGAALLHVYIIVAIVGDGTTDGTTFTLMDPAAQGEADYTFKEFLQKLEEVASEAGATEALQPQIAYNLPAKKIGYKQPPYKRADVREYARIYATRAASDRVVMGKLHGPYVKEDGSLGVPEGDVENDCTHFISCCVGMSPKDQEHGISGGGLFLDPDGFHKKGGYGFTNPGPLLFYLFSKGRIQFMDAAGQLGDKLVFHQNTSAAITALTIPFSDVRGDILFYATSKSDELRVHKVPLTFWQHCSVVTANETTGDSPRGLLVAAHTGSHFDDPSSSIGHLYFVYARVMV